MEDTIVPEFFCGDYGVELLDSPGQNSEEFTGVIDTTTVVFTKSLFLH